MQNRASIVREWTFRSSSNQQVVYKTLLYSDGTASCNCPGWTRRVKNGERTCKHLIVCGIAPVQVREVGVAVQPKASGDKAVKVKPEMRVVRKFSFDD